MLKARRGWGFCSHLSTCSGSNWSLSAHNAIMSTFKEQEWRLVTNLAKLRALSSATQQVLTMWFEAVLLSLPAGNSKGHRRRCWQLLETEAEPTTHPSAPWELRDEGTIILDPLNCDWCHSSRVLWLDILPTVAWGQWIFHVGETDPQQAASDPDYGFRRWSHQGIHSAPNFFLFFFPLHQWVISEYSNNIFNMTACKDGK